MNRWRGWMCSSVGFGRILLLVDVSICCCGSRDLAFDLFAHVRSVTRYRIPRDFTCRSRVVSANLWNCYYCLEDLFVFRLSSMPYGLSVNRCSLNPLAHPFVTGPVATCPDSLAIILFCLIYCSWLDHIITVLCLFKPDEIGLYLGRYVA